MSKPLVDIPSALRLLDRVQALAPKSLTYADVRIIRSQREELQVKNAELAAPIQGESRGYGIQVLVDGFWGFSSHHSWESADVDAVIEQALTSAKLAARAATIFPAARVEWSPRSAVIGKWNSGWKIDPFTISLDKKIDTMREWDEALQKAAKISMRQSFLSFRKDRKIFCSTEGSQIEQEFVYSGMGYLALATNDSDAQVRSFPNSMGGQYSAKGWEMTKDFDFLGETERVAQEAVALLSAPQCPQGVRDIILDSSQLGLQVHESCGHPVELDRVLGWEANYAGRSFLTLEKLGTFQYGSPLVTIIGDSKEPGGLGTFGYDDEGTPSTRWNIIDKGKFSGYLTSRETSRAIGEKESRACMRADGWNRAPMVRMVNVSLEPGKWKLQDLLDDSEGALWMETNRSWSIDQLRYNFQFGTEATWEIRGGKKGPMYKNGTYQGITPEFWKSCDAICNADQWTLWGTPNCGKGEPGQIMGTGHGASPARFRNVQVGMGYSK